jgi:hypothetical protein
MMQKKLTAAELDMVINAKSALGLIPWSSMSEGFDYWRSIYEAMQAKEKHGTSDGKPWVEPPLTDEDAKQRPWVMVRDCKCEPWRGPKVLVYVEKNAADSLEFLDALGEWWSYAKKATAEEIAAREATQ